MIIEIGTLTTGQRNNPAWHLARKDRLTASNFGAVLNAKRVTQALTKRLHGDYNLVESVLLHGVLTMKKWQ